MITHEEALNICRLAIRCFGNGHSEFRDETFMRDIVERNDIEIMITALEKQIPKKTDKQKYFYGEIPCCPICREDVDIIGYKCKFCPKCGQALDWGE